MNDHAQPLRPVPDWLNLKFALLALVAITLLRIAVLFWADQDLFFDEAQYWFWSTDLVGGYFSKPPGIAVLIAATEAVCGDGEACIRLGAPLAYGLAGLLLGLTALRMAGRLAGAAVLLLFATIPGVSFAAQIISTDAPLLVFWAAALLFYHRYLESRSWADAMVLGVAIGLGFLSKYAMVYFGFCLAVHALVERQVLERLRDVKLWAALIVALIVFSPNIFWNLENGSVTLAHTANNARWGGALLNPEELAAFIGAQIGIIGPVLACVVALGLWRHFRGLTPDERYALSFSVPIMATMCAQALISRANANWAALSFPGFVLVACLFLMRWQAASGWNAKRWLTLALATHLVAFAGLSLLSVNARDWSMLRSHSPYKRVLGWTDVMRGVSAVAEENQIRSVVSNSRSVTAQLTYYLRKQPVSVYAWPHAYGPHNHYEQVVPASAAISGPILMVTRCNTDFARELAGVGESGEVTVPITKTRFRTLYWAVVDEFPQDPPALADCRG